MVSDFRHTDHLCRNMRYVKTHPILYLWSFIWNWQLLQSCQYSCDPLSKLSELLQRCQYSCDPLFKLSELLQSCQYSCDPSFETVSCYKVVSTHVILYLSCQKLLQSCQYSCDPLFKLSELLQSCQYSCDPLFKLSELLQSCQYNVLMWSFT
jgi:hypothetical protein